jgi:predicted transcriptional regulator
MNAVDSTSENAHAFEYISFRIDAQTACAVKLIARAQDRSMSSVIRQAVRDLLADSDARTPLAKMEAPI